MFICDISVLNRFAKAKLDQMLEPHGFHWREMAVIIALDSKPGINQNNIGDFLQTDKANVTKLIHQMEADGYIERKTDTKDRRQNLVYNTIKAEKVLPTLQSTMQQWEEEIYAPLTKEEQETFKRLHGKLSATLMQAKYPSKGE